MPLQSPRDLQIWQTAADAFRKDLAGKYAGICDALPHFIHHYLDDADIRMKDVKYRESQESELDRIIAQLENKQ